ncbi:protein FAR-RED IMPAIRED RESPONSE 1-like [Spinacia oleracea]|uniref:Protein FAR-RED IMPAIRED RESPONSE 1-like n=1 Tax=Spinacia oleracea TaxID=3562 RepID=A0ABM3RHK8_SPIOL|nr:protein FAR-RED IMPAIRED RESPONSE 1-like [Spinacia oleracea]
MEGSGAEIGDEIGDGSREVDGEEEEEEDFIWRYEPQSSSDKEGLGFMEGGEDCFTTPKKRMVVTDYGEEEEVLELKGYAKQKGFGVARHCGSVKSSVGSDKEKGIGKEKRNCLWTCECYGVPERRRKVIGDKVASDSKLHEITGSGVRKSKKCQCPVHVFASVNKLGEWVIRRAVMVHENHHPTPSKSRIIAYNRKKFLRENPHVLTQANVCSKSGMSVAQTYNLMAVQHNGRGRMPFLRKDLNDVVAKERKARTSGGDAKAMFDYFKKMKADNSDFFHVYRQGANGILQDVLWVDARSRAAYEEFGDVVCFDSTYLTNKYKMSFANFFGVNHHGQSILLGCALVSHENSDTFEWIFGNWLECMGGKAPIGILTDQDPAMRRALRSTMSDTCHRWCI